MNNSQSQQIKSFKSSRRVFIIIVFMALISLVQIIFTSPDHLYKFMHWVQFIIFTIFSISNWLEFKKAKKQLQNQP